MIHQNPDMLFINRHNMCLTICSSAISIIISDRVWLSKVYSSHEGTTFVSMSFVNYESCEKTILIFLQLL